VLGIWSVECRTQSTIVPLGLPQTLKSWTGLSKMSNQNLKLTNHNAGRRWGPNPKLHISYWPGRFRPGGLSKAGLSGSFVRGGGFLSRYRFSRPICCLNLHAVRPSSITTRQTWLLFMPEELRAMHVYRPRYVGEVPHWTVESSETRLLSEHAMKPHVDRVPYVNEEHRNRLPAVTHITFYS